MRTLKRRGFTFIELMFAISIMAILIAIAVPSMNNLRKRRSVRSTVSHVIGDLRLASAEALRSECDVVVTFEKDISTNSYRYKIHRLLRDINDDGVIDHNDIERSGLILESDPTGLYGGGILWGGGLNNNTRLTFGKGGGVVADSTGLTRQTLTRSDINLGKDLKYYRFYITTEVNGENLPRGEYYIIQIVEDDGRVIYSQDRIE